MKKIISEFFSSLILTKSLVLDGVVTPSDYADNSSPRHPRVDDLGLAVDEPSQGVLEPAIHFHHLAGWILLNYQ